MKKPLTTLLITAFVLSIFLIFIGCETDSEYPKWSVENITLFGHIPRWSPDGNSILFADDNPLNAGLWTWSLTDRVNRMLDSLPSHNWDYCWSPDGEMIAFSAPGESGSPDKGIWLYYISDDTLVRILDRGRDVSWYHDESSIVARLDQLVTGIPGIYHVDINSSETEFICEGYFPKASPSEPWIAYNESEIDGRLYIIDEMFESVEVAELGAQLHVWSADGKTLSCIVNDYISGVINGKLFRIEYSDSTWNAEEIVTDKASYPAPSRNGSLIAYMAMNNNASWDGIKLFGSGGGEGILISAYGFNPEFNPVDDGYIVADTPDNGLQLLERR